MDKGDFHGKGTYYWTNGDWYEGDFVKESATGRGRITGTTATSTPAHSSMLCERARAQCCGAMETNIRVSGWKGIQKGLEKKDG